eukprot:CAMPEP_0118633586 /NCGR_PEP_ID=MMETSP0785-20121206/1080_1 /TAXON_ID=91992 /ORGANISM="Bolidomonas pacifica, Strain CCMP 1866" /LENGTH=379 /DNA_ID=CAMNT_0006524479 /DNA_START=1 /DNA_END=1140 /DNA_ORIENTATION=+
MLHLFLLALLLLLPFSCPSPQSTDHSLASLPRVRIKWPSPNLPTSQSSLELHIVNLPPAVPASICIEYLNDLSDSQTNPKVCTELTTENTAPEYSEYYKLSFTHRTTLRVVPGPVTLSVSLLVRSTPVSISTVAFTYTNSPTPRLTESGGASGLALQTKNLLLHSALGDAPSHLPPAILTLPGMSGPRFRTFLNSIVSLHPPYLEIGVWTGSTLVAAGHGNDGAGLVGIDNWSEYGGPREVFIGNVEAHLPGRTVTMIEGSCWDSHEELTRTVEELGKFGVYFFDGPHEVMDHYRAILEFLPYLKHEAVVVVDDWNFVDVRDGTRAALDVADIEVLYEASITTGTNTIGGSEWHNGVGIFVVRMSGRNAGSKKMEGREG